MDPTGLVAVALVLSVAGVLFYRFARKMNLVDQAKSWPGTDATIQSSALEVVAHARYGEIELPCFAFSYVVGGQYYSGRFALMGLDDRPDDLLKTLVDTKLRVNYNPKQPAQWHIPQDRIEGYQVEQRISAELAKLYPDE